MLWNGVIDFFYANYLSITIAVLIQFRDPRFTSEYVWKEQMNSYINLIYAIELFAFPVIVTVLYAIKLGRVDPPPDLDEKAPIEEIHVTYGHSNFDVIRKMYTVSKHEHFM